MESPELAAFRERVESPESLAAGRAGEGKGCFDAGMKEQLASAIFASLKYLAGLGTAALVAHDLLAADAAAQLDGMAVTAISATSGFLAAVVAGVGEHAFRRLSARPAGAAEDASMRDHDAPASGGGSRSRDPLPLVILCACAAALVLTSCAEMPATVRITDGLGNGISYGAEEGLGVVFVVPADSGK